MSHDFESVFNAEMPAPATSTSLFLQPRSGLIDSINRSQPVIWGLYKKLKLLDWSEDEFDFTSCAVDFVKCPPIIKDMMIKTIAWQWEADSMAAFNLIPLVAPFVSSTELWLAWVRVDDNEGLHGLTYAEIVRCSFESPRVVMAEVLAESQALKRLSHVGVVMADVKRVGIELTLGQISPASDAAYDAIFMFVVANYALERIQFTSSFLVTFAIANTGWFMPIGQAVQKICTDELTIHVPINQAALLNELSTERGRAALARLTPRIVGLIESVRRQEHDWTHYLFGPNELPGVTDELACRWVDYSTQPVYDTLGLPLPFDRMESNPVPFMSEWLDINTIQGSPQEARPVNYLLGGVIDTVGDSVRNIDF